MISGIDSLDRQVKWSHILETTGFESLINDGELILTTDAGSGHNSASQITYVERPIARNVSGIRIELGYNFKVIPT